MYPIPLLERNRWTMKRAVLTAYLTLASAFAGVVAMTAIRAADCPKIYAQLVTCPDQYAFTPCDTAEDETQCALRSPEPFFYSGYFAGKSNPSDTCKSTTNSTDCVPDTDPNTGRVNTKLCYETCACIWDDFFGCVVTTGCTQYQRSLNKTIDCK